MVQCGINGRILTIVRIGKPRESTSACIFVVNSALVHNSQLGQTALSPICLSVNEFAAEFDARAMMRLIASPDDQFFWKDIEAGKLAHGLQGPVLEALAETYGTSVRRLSAERSNWDFIREMSIVATSMTAGFDQCEPPRFYRRLLSLYFKLRFCLTSKLVRISSPLRLA